jgi:multiple sugar transport system permease protein
MNRSRRQRRRRLNQIAGALVVCFITAIILMPLFWMISFSLRTNTDLLASPSIIPTRPTLRNYVDFWDVAPFETFFRNSLIVSLCTVITTLSVATPAGYALSRFAFRGRQAVGATLIFMQILPGYVLIVPMYLLARELGLFNSLQGLVLVYTGLSLSFAILLSRGFFGQLPRELEEAARVDGASNFQSFRHIALPLIRPGLLALATFVFIGAWEEFVLALTLTTRSDVRTVPIGVSYFFEQYQSNYTGLMAASIVSIVPVLILFFAVGRGFVRGIASGGVKG